MNLSYTNIDVFCRGVDLTQQQPTIDMTPVTFVEPFALIYLGMFLRHHNRQGRYFKIMPPVSAPVNSDIESQNFLARFNIRTPPTNSTATTVVRRFNPETSFNDIIDIENVAYVAEDIGYKVRDLLRSEKIQVDTLRVEEWISELVDNFSQHSEEELAACAVQWSPNRGHLHFAIGDCGIGIRKSLSKKSEFSSLQHRDHREAAKKSLEPGVGRKIEGGMGLTDVSQNVADIGGSLFLATGDGWVEVRGNRTRTGSQEYDLPGVQINLSVPTGE